MKKTGITVLMMLSAIHLFAQSEDHGVRLGLMLSPQINWMNGGDKNVSGNGANIGFSYGFLMDVLIPKNYAFATGLIVSYEGGNLEYEENSAFNSYEGKVFSPGATVTYHSQYVQIPLTMKLRTNQIGYMTYFGQVGLQGGFCIRSRADFNGTTTDSIAVPIREDGVNFSKDITLPDLGLLIGGGLERELTGNTALHVSLQFYNGFIDATDDPKDYKVKSTLGHLRLQLGVYF